MTKAFLLVGLLAIAGWSGPRASATVADPQRRVTYDHRQASRRGRREARGASEGRRAVDGLDCIEEVAALRAGISRIGGPPHHRCDEGVPESLARIPSRAVSGAILGAVDHPF